MEGYKGIYPKIHESAYVAPSADVIGAVYIEEDCSIWHNAVLRGDVDDIIIRKGANIQDGCILHCSHKMKTTVGEGTTVGHNAVLHSCTIGKNSLIGMGAVILDGAVIGDNCLVAAGALVTPGTNVPDGVMVMGSPAKVKRELVEEEIKGIRENAKEYIALKNEYR
ncbi:MAG: gamma carbonic anhydrase family protein [Clostridia bacterium]|nr:gamma carbonic anhydrase family protein [Clostridia bacterium]MBN2883991.1 gamma carbonic anhydrase family protein [Clostridia bacterium]